ncbi:uncharacterized protein TRIADDRAFT_60036 [Trichoplax adhaerens]|uniref:Uncharacterized protein n=1 Tax=Trichoplax adhaerens TaxID=10228 RepID=B3S745_TRIAD|nr:hypothetical protein TRIADDRAFT_60036 [Trichoplax adhaerens]EDV21509.1 hypothetical protein TRIADDRAFT_60036 [Trichoplax adhaerens]|eukprot:XP_002116109.1 hypothetical protein TRIADDRAFT_60036 [Trichoplax adhaerens]
MPSIELQPIRNITTVEAGQQISYELVVQLGNGTVPISIEIDALPICNHTQVQMDTLEIASVGSAVTPVVISDSSKAIFHSAFSGGQADRITLDLAVSVITLNETIWTGMHGLTIFNTVRQEAPPTVTLTLQSLNDTNLNYNAGDILLYNYTAVNTGITPIYQFNITYFGSDAITTVPNTFNYSLTTQPQMCTPYLYYIFQDTKQIYGNIDIVDIGSTVSGSISILLTPYFGYFGSIQPKVYVKYLTINGEQISSMLLSTTINTTNTLNITANTNTTVLTSGENITINADIALPKSSTNNLTISVNLPFQLGKGMLSVNNMTVTETDQSINISSIFPVKLIPSNVSNLNWQSSINLRLVSNSIQVEEIVSTTFRVAIDLSVLSNASIVNNTRFYADIKVKPAIGISKSVTTSFIYYSDPEPEINEATQTTSNIEISPSINKINLFSSAMSTNTTNSESTDILNTDSSSLESNSAISSATSILSNIIASTTDDSSLGATSMTTFATTIVGSSISNNALTVSSLSELSGQLSHQISAKQSFNTESTAQITSNLINSISFTSFSALLSSSISEQTAQLSLSTSSATTATSMVSNSIVAWNQVQSQFSISPSFTNKLNPDSTTSISIGASSIESTVWPLYIVQPATEAPTPSGIEVDIFTESNNFGNNYLEIDFATFTVGNDFQPNDTVYFNFTICTNITEHKMAKNISIQLFDPKPKLNPKIGGGNTIQVSIEDISNKKCQYNSSGDCNITIDVDSYIVNSSIYVTVDNLPAHKMITGWISMTVSPIVNPNDTLQCSLEITYSDVASIAYFAKTISNPIDYTESPIITISPDTSTNITDLQQEVEFNLQITTIPIPSNYTIEIYASRGEAILELVHAQVDSVGNAVYSNSWNNLFTYHNNDLDAIAAKTKGILNFGMASSPKHASMEDRNISISFTVKLAAITTNYNHNHYWIQCNVIAGPNAVLTSKSAVYIAIHNLTSYAPDLKFDSSHNATEPIEQMQTVDYTIRIQHSTVSNWKANNITMKWLIPHYMGGISCASNVSTSLYQSEFSVHTFNLWLRSLELKEIVVFNVTMKKKINQDPVQNLILIINSYYENPINNEKIYIPRIAMSVSFIHQEENTLFTIANSSAVPSGNLPEFHFRDYLVYENGFFACTRENMKLGWKNRCIYFNGSKLIDLDPMIGNIAGRSMSTLFVVSRNGKICMRNIESYSAWGSIPDRQIQSSSNYTPAINISEELPEVPTLPHVHNLPDGKQLGVSEKGIMIRNSSFTPWNESVHKFAWQCNCTMN